MLRNFLAMTCALAFCLAGTVSPVWPQEAAAGVEGAWKGTLAAGPAKLRLVLDISKTADGLYLGTLDSVDQGAKIPIDVIHAKGSSLRLEIKSIDGVFEGTVNDENSAIKGTWTQMGRPLPLEFTRAEEPAQPAKSAEPAKPPEPKASPLGVELDLGILIAPTPFIGGGKKHLAYELHITNFSGRELVLKRLDVIGKDSPIASFEGAELNSLLFRPGAHDTLDKRAIGPGLRAVAYLWITLDPSQQVPASLRHRITVGDQSVEGGAITVQTAKPVVLAPPLRGSDWLALNGPSNTSIHRRAMIALAGKASIAQRFAIDWVKMGPGGSTVDGDRKDNKNYHAYGSEILAVADSVVTSTKDGIPENVPGPKSRAVPISLETIGGNYVILDLGGGRFAFYAHLQPGSLQVKRGDRVRRGQFLARVGNSGNSTEPHLHFHVSDADSPLASEGLPFALESFEVLKGSNPGPRRNSLPLQNDRVRFAESQ